MKGSLVWLCEPFGRACPVGALPEDARVTFPIGLKRDSAAVGAPRRESIVAAESQRSRGARAREVVHKDVGDSAIVSPEGELPAIGRYARVAIVSGRELQCLHGALSIEPAERVPRGAACDGALDVRKRAGLGKHVEGGPGIESWIVRAANALQDRNRRADYSYGSQVEP